MFFEHDKQQLRQMYADAWRKHLDSAPMEPLERLIAEIIFQHQEFQELFGADADDLEREFPADIATNPWLHMGLHIALREQLATDRPRGVIDVFARLVASSPDPHAAEHKAMECLANALWAAQSRGEIPNETAYLAELSKLA